MTDSYIRTAVIIEVHDGDTCTAVLDLGFRLTATLKLRLNRIDAPELTTPEGKAARDYLRLLMHDVDAVQTYKDPRDKYGRWLAELYAGDVNVNDRMVQDGQARYYDGGRKLSEEEII